MNKSYFQGTGRLLRLLFQQHRLKILLWIFGLVGVSLVVALLYPEIYTQEDIMGFAITMENPAMKALIGANYAAEDYNVGVIFASEMLLFTSMAVATMNVLLMKASSREDEEEGRLEIIRSLPTGKIAYPTASSLLLFLVNGAIVSLLTGGLATLGVDIFTWESSFLYSAILGVTGLFFAGITAIAAQLADTAYRTSVLSFSLLLLAYAIRVIGDVLNETLSLLSPLGWTTRTSVFVDDNWLPVVVLGVSSLLLFIVAFYLHARRDMFAGILPDRPGKKTSFFLFKNPFRICMDARKN